MKRAASDSSKSDNEATRPPIASVGRFARSLRTALAEDHRLLIGATAFGLAAFIAYRLVLLFGLTQ